MNLWKVIACCIVVCVAATDASSCTPNDYRFEYTVCDSEAQRWRVSVPKIDCQPEGERAPFRGAACNHECDGGSYLAMDTQKCKECEPGTYSMGNTAKYEEWSSLPEGFTTAEQDISLGFVSAEGNCSEHGWTPKGSYIAVSPGGCSSYLRYSGTLIKAGNVNFKYKLPDASIIFHVTVQNDQCQKEEDSGSSVWPETTVDSKWGEARVALGTGFNVITWKVIGLSLEETDTPVIIKSITIEGAAYSSECQKCPPGTYSSKGASECTLCKENQYSAKGAPQCSDCDKATEWSRGGAEKCEKRPSCTESDYYQLRMPCDENKKTSTIYQWIQPQICQPNNPDSVHLPPNGAPEDCKPCNPGMHLVNNTCRYCPKDSRSDGTKCEKCDASTFPDIMYKFENWNSIPEELGTECISFSDSYCHNDSKWLPMGDHLETHFARGESAYVIIQAHVGGFRTASAASDEEEVTVGKFSITFETRCKDYCQFVLLNNEKGYQDILNIWSGNVSRHKYEYNVKKNKPMTFAMAFQNSAYMLNSDEYKNASALIYSIEITNTIGGGATTCQKCPKGLNKQGCIPCPDGQFIDPANTTCVICPPGTVVYNPNSYGAESCKPCGKGLKPEKGKTCITDGLFQDDLGREYDLRNLTASTQFLKGSPLFTSTGTQYYHGFNISLFGSPVMCANNMTKSNESQVLDKESKQALQTVRSQSKVEAMICRSTMVPTAGDSSVVIATQSASLGDRLVAIVWNETQQNNATDTDIKKLYLASGFDITDIENHIQFHYTSTTPTRACSNGRKTVISLSCDLDEKDNGVIEVPPKCADGTCDGCTFHFLWRSRVACPTCKKEDFEKVTEECIKGQQKIHYFPPAHCIVRDKATKLEEIQKCTLKLSALPFVFQVAIPAVVALASILCCLLCYTWRKNKKLEYKYMKLVEGSEGKEGELPGVDSCALEEGEDEGGDAVLIKDSKGARFFKKLKNKMKKVENDSDSWMMTPLTQP